MTHVLDKPIWAALETRQSALASGDGIARRFPEDISPFVAAHDNSADAVAALVKLIPSGDDVSFLEVAPPGAPVGVTATEAVCVQMTATTLAAPKRNVSAMALGEADAADMLELALLTRPGPFRQRTHTLGRFIGVRDNGRLIAMAGERLHLPGYREISAVCTHPDYQGRGLGAALLCGVGKRMLEEGDIPFLHSYASNATAIGLYTRLGFTPRANVVHAIWKRT